MTLGERLKKLRESKGLSQSQLAEEVSITKQAISKYEKDMLSPAAPTLAALADALECSTDYLLGRSEQ